SVFSGYFNQISRLGTPIFAVISAFLLSTYYLIHGFFLNSFMRSRFTKILVPYLIWITVYLYYLGVVEVTLNSNTNFIEYYLYGTGNYHLYFILTVIEFYILFPILQKIKKGPFLLLVYARFTIINVLWLLYNSHLSIDIPIIGVFISSRSFILNWISYFMLGIIFAKYYEEINIAVKKYKALFLPIIAMLSISFFIFIDLDNLKTSSHPIFLFYIPFFLVFLIYFYTLIKYNNVIMMIFIHIDNYSIVFLIYFYTLIKNNNVIMKTLTQIGNYSMGIFLVHPLIKWIVFKIPIFDNRDSFFLLFLSYILIVALSVIVIGLLIKIPNGNF